MVLTSTRVTSAGIVRTCPLCSATVIATIPYEPLAASEQFEADLAADRIVLGGCPALRDPPDQHTATWGLEFHAHGRPAIAESTRRPAS